MTSKTDSVPVIDLAFAGSKSTLSADELAANLKSAMAVSGFFYVRNHAIDPLLVQAVVEQTHAFFDLPLAARQAIAIDLHNRGYLGQGEARMYGATRNDLKEVFFFGRDLAPDDPDIVAGVPLCAVNQWPDANLLPLFRPTVVNYLQAAAITGSQLLRGFASLLEAPEDFFESRYQRPMARGQLIHYPAPPEQAPDDQFGVAPHTDFGCITMLYQHTPGLEVQSRSGQWIAVPPIPGTVVINIGDLLERWSNGRLPSTKHRVRNLTGASRYSIAVFYDPSATAVVDPADLIHSKSHAEPGFAPMTAANYILSRSQKVFAQFDKSISQGVSSSSGM